MSDMNPFASPLSSEYVLPPTEQETTNQWLFRKGNLLVMHKRAMLPDRCVKSNQPAEGRRLTRKLYWHHPAIYFAILVHVFIYVILAVVLRKKATIAIGLSEEWFRKRRRAILIGWTLVLGGIAAAVAGCVTVEQHPVAGLGILLGALVGLGGAIYGLVAARMVAAKRISDEYVWLKGVHREFLASLPAWPYEP